MYGPYVYSSIRSKGRIQLKLAAKSSVLEPLVSYRRR